MFDLIKADMIKYLSGSEHFNSDQINLSHI